MLKGRYEVLRQRRSFQGNVCERKLLWASNELELQPWAILRGVTDSEKNGVVTYGEIENDINALHSKTPWSRATGFNTKSCEARSKFAGMSMADYMRYLWNNPQNGQSPYKLFEGALIPRGKDSHGNLVYHHNGTTE